MNNISKRKIVSGASYYQSSFLSKVIFSAFAVKNQIFLETANLLQIMHRRYQASYCEKILIPEELERKILVS